MDSSCIAFRFALFKDVLAMYGNVFVANNKVSGNYAWADGFRLAYASWICIYDIVEMIMDVGAWACTIVSIASDTLGRCLVDKASAAKYIMEM